MNNPQWFIKQTQHRESLTELVHLFSTLTEKVANIILLFKFCDLEKLLQENKFFFCLIQLFMIQKKSALVKC